MVLLPFGTIAARKSPPLMHRFHVPDLSNAVVELPEEEAGHAVRVLRLKDDEPVVLVDGNGTSALGRLKITDKHAVCARIEERTLHAKERVARIHLAVAPTKQVDRFEWMLEKCTEIGVDRITPLMTGRTERTHLRMDRLRKVMVSAMKQSQRAWLPQLDAPATIAGLLGQALPAQRYFGWCEGEHSSLSSAYRTGADAIMLIGPEGDFTEEEAQLLRAHACQAVGLGKARLRTETAAIAACTWMNLKQM